MLPVELVCPRCRSSLGQRTNELACTVCSAEYPIVAGIPDLRITPDPWIGVEQDREKGLLLAERTRGAGFEETVRAYWDMTPSTPRHHAQRFIAHVLRAEERSREWLMRTDGALAAGPWLDLGCGTGDIAAAASTEVIGVDVAFRWLVVARKRLQERGRPAHLVCANAEHLPFPSGTFSRILALGLLEHCADADAVFQEAARVLDANGELRLRTVHRYSLLPEPHVGVFGVGFLPRRLADAYVRFWSGQRYLLHFPIGHRALEKKLRAAGLEQVKVEPAMLLSAEIAALPRALRAFAVPYERLRTTGAGRALALLAPLLEARAFAPHRRSYR